MFIAYFYIFTAWTNINNRKSGPAFEYSHYTLLPKIFLLTHAYFTDANSSACLDYSKQVKQRVSENFMYIHNLEERIPYTFSVRAQTIDYGPPAIGNVTTGPQPGSPGRPRDLVLSQVGA